MFTQGRRRSEEGDGNTTFIHEGGEDKWTQVEHIKAVKVITQMGDLAGHGECHQKDGDYQNKAGNTHK